MDFSFKSIVVHGLVKDNSGVHVPIRIKSGTLCVPLNVQPPDKGAPQHVPIYTERAARLRAPLTSLPLIKDIDLHLVLEQQLTTDQYQYGYFSNAEREFWRQKTSEVYIVSVDFSLSESSSQTVQIPRKMIIKIAGQTAGMSLAKEAAAYNHLLCLQGTVIPRCYGYFRETINLQEYVVTPWDPQCKFPRSCEDLDIFNMPNSCASLNILLFECVGENLTMEYVIPQSRKELRAMLYSMCEELCHFGIYHEDMRSANVLQVQDTGTEGPCSPFLNKRYNCRIIDLETVTIMERREEWIMRQMEGEIDEIIGRARIPERENEGEDSEGDEPSRDEDEDQ